MVDEGSNRHYYPEHMQHNMGNPDVYEMPSSHVQDSQPAVRNSAKWEQAEHKIFIVVCEHVIDEGHRRGKCFSTTGWQRICTLFNSKVGKDWTISQLKNYWAKLRTEHKHLFELLRCSGIQYHSGSGTIVAPQHWWEAKILENRKYAKYKNMNCSDIYDNYGKLFGDTGDSTKYALSPTKLSQRGFDLGTDSDRDDEGDKLPINAEGTDSSDSPVERGGQSSMKIFGSRSGDKRKMRHGKDKGKRKKYGAREVSASLEQMVSVGTDLASIARSHQKDDMSIEECVSEMLSSGHVDEGSPIHMFALWFLHVKEIEVLIVRRRPHSCGISLSSTVSSATRYRLGGRGDR